MHRAEPQTRRIVVTFMRLRQAKAGFRNRQSEEARSIELSFSFGKISGMIAWPNGRKGFLSVCNHATAFTIGPHGAYTERRGRCPWIDTSWNDC
jgi:hypothetical protein